MHLAAFFCQRLNTTERPGQLDIIGVGIKGFHSRSLPARPAVVLVLTTSREDRGRAIITKSLLMPDGTSRKVGPETVQVDITDDNEDQLWVDGDFTLPAGSTPGRYRLEYFMNGQPVAQIPFVVYA